MGVVNTRKWLHEYIEVRKDTKSNDLLQLQNKMLCEPIANFIKKHSSSQLHQYFLGTGLFYPDAQIEEIVEHFEKENIWKLAEQQYQYLKKKWNGVSAKIFIYPVERRNKFIMEQLKGKMGISFQHIIVLFLSDLLSKDELRAIVTHEYNHVCRLHYVNKEFHELTLLDSMIIEGLGEVAVVKELGKEQLAPWNTLYSKTELLRFWPTIVQKLATKGKENHDPILFGSNSYHGLPKWFGYCIGYIIVNSLMEHEKNITMIELLQMSSEEILKRSKFE